MLVGQPHQLDKALAKLVELAARLHHALGHDDVAVGRSGKCKGILHVHAIPVGQVLGHHGCRGFAQLNALAARQNCSQDTLLIIAHKDEFAIIVGFLDEFQQFVGSLFLQLLGQPHDKDLILCGIGTQGHFAHDAVGLAHKDLRLGIIILQQSQPCLIVLDRVVGDKLSPLVDIVTGIAGTVAVALAVGKRVAEVRIHLVERLVLAAHGAHAARVAVNMIAAVQILRGSHRQPQFGNTRLTIEQQCMRQAVGINHVPYLPYCLLVA